MALQPQNAIYVIDLFGTASFAFSGALRAIDRRPDFVGMVLLAGATAVGGGVLRDIILRREAFIVHDWGYPAVILASVVVTFLFPAMVVAREKLLRYFDAVGLGVFSAVTASALWQTPGTNPLSVLFIATFTGCAGGVIRDLLIDKPSLVLQNELYVTPVVIGAAGLMLVCSLGAGELTGFFTAMLLTTILRCVAIYRDWRLPRILALDPSPRAEPSHAASKADFYCDP